MNEYYVTYNLLVLIHAVLTSHSRKVMLKLPVTVKLHWLKSTGSHLAP